MTAKTWTGATVTCDTCESQNCEYVKDVDHDGGSCEVYKCLDCQSRFHIELPDA